MKSRVFERKDEKRGVIREYSERTRRSVEGREEKGGDVKSWDVKFTTRLCSLREVEDRSALEKEE